MTSHPRPNLQLSKSPATVCHKEIPLSEPSAFEAEDYVAHFCGLECYSAWKQRSEVLEQQDKKPALSRTAYLPAVAGRQSKPNAAITQNTAPA